MIPAASVAHAVGWFSVAFSAYPSVDPAVAEPATVVTARVERVTRRIRWLLRSVTYTKPLTASTAQSLGSENEATVPTPLTTPAAPVPATVVTKSPAESRRSLCCGEFSTKYTLPAESVLEATVQGRTSAVATGPSVLPVVPGVPAANDVVHTKSSGSAGVPTPLQATGQVQGMGRAAPPVQKKPAAQSVPVELVDAGRHVQPGAAVQGPLHAAVV